MAENQWAFPPLHEMVSVSGYDDVTYELKKVKPPRQFASYDESDERKHKSSNIADFTLQEDTIREALLSFVSENCCYGKNPAETCTLDNIVASCGYQYKLKTYSEKREICWDSEPYSDQSISGVLDGRAPEVWELSIDHEIPEHKEGSKTTEVPFTASIKSCNICDGKGNFPCSEENCFDGKLPCGCRTENGEAEQSFSDADCEEEHDHCESCQCKGLKNCEKCEGKGKLPCERCNGSGLLKWFIKLVLTMDMNKSDDFVDKSGGASDLPEDAGMKGKGEKVFKEEGVRVEPILDFPDQDVIDISAKKIEKHKKDSKKELVHWQKQTVSVIPLTRVQCTFEGEQRTFYVYGKENKVFFPDYYSQCACCTIL